MWNQSCVINEQLGHFPKEMDETSFSVLVMRLRILQTMFWIEGPEIRPGGSISNLRSVYLV